MSPKASDRAKINETAEHYIKVGKIAEAVAEYQKLLDGTAQDIPIANIIGDLCLQINQEDKAIGLFLANVDALERRGAYSQALAIAKKIYKIRPSVVESMIRLGDLYGQLGFTAEAQAEYARASDELEKRQQTGLLIALYEKRVRLDRADLTSRLKLAGLYLEDSQADRALAELNDSADLLYVRNENDEAEKILREALAIQDGHTRTLANLARIYRALDRPESAVSLLEQSIEKHGSRSDLLMILADLFWEKGDDDRAAEVFGRIIETDPGNNDVRAKLGQVEIRRGRLDRAFELFDPLVSFFIQKNDEEKAIGLLGLILLSGTLHLPALERLAGVFRTAGRLNDFETALRLLLAEYRKAKRDSDRIRILRELFPLASMDPALMREAEELGVKSELRFSGAEQGPAGGMADEDRDVIRMNLAKSVLYVEQGLIRNARRILENLQVLYPDDPRVVKKIEELRHIPMEVEEEEIPEIVEQIARRETIIGGPETPPPPGPSFPLKSRAAGASRGPAVPPADKTPPPMEPPNDSAVEPGIPEEPPAPPAAREAPMEDKPGPPPAPPKPRAAETGASKGPAAPTGKKTRGTEAAVLKGEAAPPAPPPQTPKPAAKPAARDQGPKVTAAEIFSGLDLVPMSTPPVFTPVSSPGYLDIEEKIEEEIEAIEAEFYKQLKEKTSVIEKDLIEIVQEFRRQVDAKLDKKNYEARYNLGLAFMEQSLVDEAIAEFELAAGDEERAADCWGLIGRCYIQKRNYLEARRSLEKAVSLTAPESAERLALAYDLASLYETLDENEAALALYREVQEWNPKYRNTAKRIKILEKIVS